MRRQVLGDDHVQRSLDAATDFSRPMQELVTEYCWGAVWTRPGLVPRDRYADALAAAPDAKGVVVGYAAAKEDEAGKGGKNFAAQRAVNTKDYLTKEKGIDPARIEARTGSGDPKVELWIVPAGAVFPPANTTAVDEAMVKPVPRVAPKRKKAHGKALPQGQ